MIADYVALTFLLIYTNHRTDVLNDGLLTVQEAMLKLMQPTPWLPPGHPLLAYEYAESDKWSADEVDTFHQGLLKFDKDFRTISQEVSNNNVDYSVHRYLEGISKHKFVIKVRH